MKRTRHWIIVVTVLALVGSWALSFGVGRLQAQAQAEFAPSRVAVVNLSEVFNASLEFEAFNQELVKEEKDFQAERTAREQAIEVMRNDLKILQAGSPEAITKEEEILQKLAEFQAWQQLRQALAVREQRLKLIVVYRKIYDTTQSIAKQRGIEIVVLDTPLPNLDQVAPDQLLNVMGSRNVMYKSDRVDITTDVTTQLNTDYKNR
ncbi:MAG: OmpH family outer membrane protein [Planctomycetota bacterium]